MVALPSRNRRPPEKKPTRLLLLVAVLCLASFFGGVWFGRGKQEVVVDQPSLQTLAAEVPRGMPVEPPKSPAGTENLTFFETLSKGEQSPLGSGINLRPVGEAAMKEVSSPAQTTSAVVHAAPAATAAPPVTTAVAAGAYLVQAASFSKEEDAQALQGRLLKKSYPAYIQNAQLGERGTWYRVMLGPFENATAAERMVARLQVEEKLSAMVRKR
jgi:DedD protein